MSKKFFATTAAAVLAASTASAQIDWANPTFSIEVVPGDVTPVTGAGVSNLGILDVDSAGDVVFYDRADGMGTAGALLKADLSGANPIITVIADEPTILSAANPAATFWESNGLHVIPGGGGDEYVMIAFNSADDDVVRIVPGSPATASSVLQTDGIAGLAVDGTTIYLSVEGAFGAVEDAVLTTDLAGNSSTYVSSADIAGATGGATGEINGIDTNAAGDVFFFSEGFFGGTDSILVATAPNTVSEFIPAAEPPSTMGLRDIEVASDGTFFLWDRFPGSGGTRLLIRESNGTYTEILAADIETALGLAATPDVAAGGMASNVPNASTVELYLADNATDQILKLTFTDSSNVGDWAILE